jgi:hypothetical protein
MEMKEGEMVKKIESSIVFAGRPYIMEMKNMMIAPLDEKKKPHPLNRCPT